MEQSAEACKSVARRDGTDARIGERGMHAGHVGRMSSDPIKRGYIRPLR